MQSDDHQDDKTQSHIALTKGAMVSHYRIVEKIGAGGMGEVYLAEDTKLKRQVALKFLPSHLCQDEDCRTRFKREAQAAAKLDHPNIVTVYEVSEYQRRPFFAMQHVEGQSLRELIKTGDIGIDRAVNLTIQVCEGLGKAHQAGITHRDVKPSNIVIDADGRPKLLDFGLAAVKGGEDLTRTGSTLGTVGYMSPGQVRGDVPDARSDLFSLGVVLYEMITGVTPFRGENEATTLKAILEKTPEPLARYKSDVPDDLQRIVSKLLEKDRELRHQSAADVISDLKRLRRDSESAILPQPHRASSSRMARFLVPALILIAAVVVLVLKPWKFELQPTEEVVAAENRLAIMYFDNLTDPDDSLRLGEIAANLLITDLTESQYLDVVSSQRLYDILKLLGKEGEKRIDRSVATEVARKARSKWMLLGSILQAKPQIVLTCQLVEVESGSVVASQRITGVPEENIFAVIDRLTVEIKNDLSLPAAAQDDSDRPIAEVTTHSSEAYRYYLEGVDNYYKHYATEAKASFRKALAFDSTFAMAYNRLAGLMMGSVEERKEMAALAAKYSQGVGEKGRYSIASRLAELDGDYEQAIGWLQKIAERYPEEKEAFFGMGFYYYHELKRYDEGIEYLNRAIEIDPLFTESYNQLAYLYNNLGQLEKSVWAINKYISLAPDEANPYDSKGEIYASHGMLNEAIESFKKAVEIKPDFYASWKSLGHMYVFKGQYADAETCYEKVLSSPGKSWRSSGRLGLALIPLHQGKLDQALTILDQGIAADRMERAEGWMKYLVKVNVHEATGNTEQMLSETREAIKAWSAHYSGLAVPFRHIEVLLLAELGRYAEAEEVLKIWRQRIEHDDPSKMDYYWIGLGCLEYGRGNYETAVRELTKATEGLTDRLNPVGFRLHFLLARTYQEWGKLGEAVAEYEKLLSNYSAGRIGWCVSSVMVHYYLGQAYEESGWTDKAIEQYETFLDIWKNADEGLQSVDDAKERLARLKS